MTEEEQPELAPGKIWTPPESLEVNVQRMAWTLFLEQWKAHVGKRTINELVEGAPSAYVRCLDAAKVVRQCELDAGGS